MAIKTEWIEVSPGRYERPIDSLEKFFVAVGKLGAAVNQEHFALSFGVKIHTSLPNLEAALRQTWIALRSEHPKLAAVIEGDRFVYEPATPESIGAWANETFIVKDGLTATELYPSLFMPTPMARLFFLPKSSEVVLSTSHWRIDGVGAVQFLSLLLQRLAEPVDIKAIEWGKEVAFLTPSLDNVLSLPQVLPEDADARQNRYLFSVGSRLPSITLPPSTKSPALSAETGREELVLSQSLTSAILAGCKKAGFGPTAGVQAAMIAATQSLQPTDNPARNYVSMAAFSLREHLPEGLRNPDHSVAIYHTGLPFAITPSGSWETDGKVLNDFYRTAMNRDAVQGLASMHNKLAYQLSQPPVEGAQVAADPAISSLGLVDKYLKEHYDVSERKFDVSDFWLGSPINTGNAWVHLWTFRGHMTLSCLHNKGVYSSEQIRSWLADVKAVLRKELNIQDE